MKIIDAAPEAIAAAAPTPVVLHQGWRAIRSIGSRVPAAQSPDLTAAAARVELGWNAMTSADGAVSSYRIYRAIGTASFDLSGPLGETTTTSYVDNSASDGVKYRYLVRAVVNGLEVTPSDASHPNEIEIPAAPANMVLVHRWMANQDICGMMSRTTDPHHDYRCPYTGPGRSSAGDYYDLDRSLWLDAFEAGCNYGSVGLVAPNNAVGSDGDVYYNRASAVCYIRSSGTWKAANDATLSASERAAMVSNKPGLPPMVIIDRARSLESCQAQTVGTYGGKRLPSRKEQVAISPWSDDLSDATIETMETGTSLYNLMTGLGSGHCNGNWGVGLTGNSDTTSPANPDLIPMAITDSYGWTGWGVNKSVRTGSFATRSCVSRYGAQDIVGNVWEWMTDQVTGCGSDVCNGAVGLDGNSELLGLSLDQRASADGVSRNYFVIGNATLVNVPLAFPFPANAPSWIDATPVGNGSGQIRAGRLNDYFQMYGNSGVLTRGAFGMGSFGGTGNSGRFVIQWAADPTYAQGSVGFRCYLSPN